MTRLLDHHFIQLPITVDSYSLFQEIQHLDDESWIEHPLPNMKSISLVEPSPHKVAPTLALKRLPTLRRILGNWEIPIGLCRVSKLEVGGSVPTHVDIDYYWQHRLRIHIIVQTNKDALFGCGDHTLHLPAGEVWVSDNWSKHWVSNKGDKERIHIVIDTVGSDIIWEWIEEGWNSDTDLSAKPRVLPLYSPSMEKDLIFERSHRLMIRHPSEVREIIRPFEQQLHLQSPLKKLVQQWNSCFEQCQHSNRTKYSSILQSTIDKLTTRDCLSNGIQLTEILERQIGDSLLPPPVVQKPIFIAGTPVSGILRLYEFLKSQLSKTLVVPYKNTPWNVFKTTSDQISKAELNHTDNVQFFKQLSRQLYNPHNGKPWRDGFPADLSTPIRWLDASPKHSFRLSAIQELFPNAHFLFLLQSPQRTLHHLIEGWKTGKFVTDSSQKTTQGNSWSFIRPEGWQTTHFDNEVTAAIFQYQQCLQQTTTFLNQLGHEQYTLISADNVFNDEQYQSAVLSYVGSLLNEDIKVKTSTRIEESIDPSSWMNNAIKLQPYLKELSKNWMDLQKNNTVNWFK